jgi:hypothetical protein
MPEYLSIRGTIGSPTDLDNFKQEARLMSTKRSAQNFPESLNQGSLRRWVEKTGEGLVNRFGRQLTAELADRQWAEDFDVLESLIQEILNSTVSAIAGVVYNSYGYEAPDPNQRVPANFEVE